MRLNTLAILCASVSFIAVPAFAQSSNQANSSTSSNQSHVTHSGTNPRQELMKDLQKAGFTKIRIEPEAFIVHATNSQGEPVLMRIGPDSVQTVTAMPQNGSGNSSGSRSPSNGSSSGNSATTKE